MARINCHCHRPAMIVTSWTDMNPACRFYGYRTARPHGCGYFMWYDLPMQPRAIEVIPGLLRRLRGLEDECQKLKRREMMYLVIIGTLLILGLCSMFGSITEEDDGAARDKL